MTQFLEQVSATKPEDGKIAVFWLGQAGFLLKTSSGRRIGMDPYLSEYVMRLLPQEGLGYKRLMPAPCAPEELELDDLLISHEHPDHFDVDSIGALMANGHTRVYTCHTVAAQMAQMGLDMERVVPLAKGERVALEEYSILATDCDHGALTPDALGFVLDFGFTRLYYAGDTALSLDRLEVPISIKPEIAILPINGTYGNLNGETAAIYASRLQCKTCIPCHFWMFPLHHGDPQQIIDALPQKAPNCALKLLCQSEGCLLP